MADRTYSDEGPQCPYCERQYTADEAVYYSESYTKDDCDQCGKAFAVEVCTTTTWTCKPMGDA